MVMVWVRFLLLRQVLLQIPHDPVPGCNFSWSWRLSHSFEPRSSIAAFSLKVDVFKTILLVFIKEYPQKKNVQKLKLIETIHVGVFHHVWLPDDLLRVHPISIHFFIRVRTSQDDWFLRWYVESRNYAASISPKTRRTRDVSVLQVAVAPNVTEWPHIPFKGMLFSSSLLVGQ